MLLSCFLPTALAVSPRPRWCPPSQVAQMFPQLFFMRNQIQYRDPNTKKLRRLKEEEAQGAIACPASLAYHWTSTSTGNAHSCHSTLLLSNHCAVYRRTWASVPPMKAQFRVLGDPRKTKASSGSLQPPITQSCWPSAILRTCRVAH